MKILTKEWIKKAESDHRSAEILLENDPLLHNQVCFHCQQAAEKYLKGLLQESNQTVPRTHDLEELLDLLKPFHSDLNSLRRGLSIITHYAVEMRYPGGHSSKRQAVAALRWSTKVREACRTILKVKPTKAAGK